jgi:hypothetical protein
VQGLLAAFDGLQMSLSFELLELMLVVLLLMIVLEILFYPEAIE